jgi:lysophospholipase L1-like esterase
MIARLIRWALAPILALALASPGLAQVDPVARGLGAASLSGVNRTTLNEKLRVAMNRAAAFNPEDADVATGVTMSVAGTLDASLTKSYVAGTDYQQFGWTGGKPTLDNSVRIQMPVASLAPANGNLSSTLPATPSYNANGWEMKFWSDSPLIQIRMGGNTARGFRVVVDGRYVTKSITNYAANSSANYITLDFAGVYKPRRIELHAGGADEFVAAYVMPLASIWPPATPGVTAVTFGDSYGEGQGISPAGATQAWPKLTGRMMGWDEVRQFNVGSTGYLSDNGGLRSTLRTQLASIMTLNSDLVPADVGVVVIGNGYNDLSFGGSAVQAEVAIVLPMIRTMFPNARIVVLGSWAGARGPGSSTVSIEQGIQAAFNAWGDPNSDFIPVSPVASSSASWFWGTGYVGATNASGNSDRLVGTDGTHPTVAGQEVIARRIASALRASWARLGPLAANDNDRSVTVLAA